MLTHNLKILLNTVQWNLNTSRSTFSPKKLTSSVIDSSAWPWCGCRAHLCFLIGTQTEKNRHGNSRRRLRFLPDSIGANRHRGASKCKCRLSKQEPGPVRLLVTSGRVCLSPVRPEWGAAVFPGRQAGIHTPLPRCYQDSHWQLQESPEGRRAAGWAGGVGSLHSLQIHTKLHIFVCCFGCL